MDILYAFYAVLSVYLSGYADTRIQSDYCFKDIYLVETRIRRDIKWTRGYADTKWLSIRVSTYF